MQRDFKDVIVDEVYDDLCDRYQYASACPAPKAPQVKSESKSKPVAPPKSPSSSGTPQQKQSMANARKSAPAKPQCPNEDKKADQFSETLDFKMCKKPDGSTYGIPESSNCIKGAAEIEKKEAAEKDKKIMKVRDEVVKSGLKWLSNPFDKEAAQKFLTTYKQLRQLDPKLPPAKSAAKSLVRQGGRSIMDNLSFSEAEILDFARCQRPDGSYYGTGGVCRKGTPVSDAEEKQIQSALKELKAYKPGYQKTGGDNLQDPGQAGAYASFYQKDGDLTYTAPRNTSDAVVKETLARLKEDDPKQYTAVMKSLNSKGSPEAGMKKEAGWKGNERGEAVLKSLMDNEFKDVLGNPAPWGQGLQLDHRTAGSVGGKDTPNNWIWISTATNQTKGGLEAAAKKVPGTAQQKEAYIKQGLIKSLDANSKMSSAQVAKVKADGAAKVAAKAKGASETRRVLPTMKPEQRAALIERSNGTQMKEMLKASSAEGRNPATGRPTSYRPVLSGGQGARVRKDYGTVPQMKSLMKYRWDEKLSSSDLKNVGGILKASTGSVRSRSDKLAELQGNFPRTTGLTAAERIAILDAAE